MDSDLQHVAWFAVIFVCLTFLATLTEQREERVEGVRPGATLLPAIQCLCYPCMKVQLLTHAPSQNGCGHCKERAERKRKAAEEEERKRKAAEEVCVCVCLRARARE